MSMRSFIISGYGFCTAKIQSDKILHFVYHGNGYHERNHKRLFYRLF